MFRLMTGIALFLCIGEVTLAQTPVKPDMRSFEITPAAPPKPALKHLLQFESLADRQPGNAAILYLDAILLLGPEGKEKVQQAIAARDANDKDKFAALADELELPSVIQELELATRRDECDWEPPFRQMGAYTLLPHLDPLLRGIGRLLHVRAHRQIEQGKFDEAISTLRLGYELSNDIGREPVLVSGMVSIATTGLMNDCLGELIARPDAPNLYWALSGLAPRKEIFRHAMQGERGWVEGSMPSLMKLREGKELSADEWRALFNYIWDLIESPPEGLKRPKAIDEASPAILEQARREYAKARKMTDNQVADIEPIVVLGSYYYTQYQIMFDEHYKLRGLPYPLQLRIANSQASDIAKLREQPGNPFQMFPFDPVVRKFAEADRQLAALTSVEAIRAYAAANGGKLPIRLADVTETPVPENPATGEPFEYRVENGTATLSDSKFEPALTYTITIRK